MVSVEGEIRQPPHSATAMGVEFAPGIMMISLLVGVHAFGEAIRTNAIAVADGQGRSTFGAAPRHIEFVL